MATTVTSKRFSLSLSDGWRAFIMAVGTPVVAIILSSLQAGTFKIDWHMVGIVAASAALTYITKNFLQPTSIVIHNPDTGSVEAVKEGAEAKVISK